MNYILYDPNSPAVPDAQFPEIVKELKADEFTAIETGSMALVDYVRLAIVRGELDCNSVRFGFDNIVTSVDKHGIYRARNCVPRSPVYEIMYLYRQR